MEKMFEKIISEGKKSGKSIEEINAELKAAEQIQWIPGGRFAVSYDEDGYAKSAVRLHD